MEYIYKILKGVVNNVKPIIITIVLTIVAIVGVEWITNIPMDYNTDEISAVKEYIINSRSRKIHKIDCASVKMMSEKNKKVINDTLSNLLSENYYICNRCHAGIKRKNEVVANIITGIDSVLFGNDMIDLPPVNEYLESLDIMGQWYVDHIPTYCSIISDSATTTSISNYEANLKYIEKVGELYIYPCEYIENSIGGYNKAGDDCVRFWFSCLNSVDNKFVNQLSKYSKYKWSNITSYRLTSKNDTLQYALSNLGFEIYDQNPGLIDINNDGYNDFEILPIDSTFKLKKGDVLSRNGHIHIYLSEGENFGWGKVNNTYPQLTKTYIDYANKVIICTEEKFTRVYRYVGNKEE